ncbi:uncharacterized protein VTP21DRAFT_179 [Calcarisporiella thermophila]|uniref:uncharacterized protein n=1 Tax=Calcarisporiella thermophila TaxID=911321 RepID=UPI00374252D8
MVVQQAMHLIVPAYHELPNLRRSSLPLISAGKLRRFDGDAGPSVPFALPSILETGFTFDFDAAWKSCCNEEPLTHARPTKLASHVEAETEIKVMLPRIYFNNLPYELKLEIFKYLSIPQLLIAAQVCKSWRVLAMDGSLWSVINFDIIPKISGQSLLELGVYAGRFLYVLNLRGCYLLSSIILRTFAERCPNIRHLTIQGCKHPSSASIAYLLRHLPNLRHLNLACLFPKVNDYTLHTLATACPKLEYLNIAWCRSITDRGLTVILKGCPRLKTLKIDGMVSLGRGGDEVVAEVIKAFEGMRELRRLSMAGCSSLTDACIEQLIRYIPKLTHLNLSNCILLTNTALRHLGAGGPALEHLDLAGCSAIADDGLVALAAGCRRLRSIDLEDCVIVSDTGLRALASHCQQLEKVCLSFCEMVTDEGVEHLVRECPLVRLELDNCPLVGDAVLQAFIDRYRRQQSQGRLHENVHRVTVEVFDCRRVSLKAILEAEHAVPHLRVMSYYSWMPGFNSLRASLVLSDIDQADNSETEAGTGNEGGIEEMGGGHEGVTHTISPPDHHAAAASSSSAGANRGMVPTSPTLAATYLRDRVGRRRRLSTSCCIS